MLNAKLLEKKEKLNLTLVKKTNVIKINFILIDQTSNNIYFQLGFLIIHRVD